MIGNMVGFVFARGGSKGIPRKNVRLLAGLPLIAYSIRMGLTCLGRVVVSTDDSEIAAIARQYGAEVPFMRPADLARDDSPEWHAWQHAIREVEMHDGQRFEVFVSLPATAPLRAEEDVRACINMLLSTDADIVLTVTPASRSPYFNMVQLDSDGAASLMIRPPKTVVRRQDAPEAFDVTTVAYAARRDYVLSAHGVLDGKVKAVVVPRVRALDIDSELDLAFAEFMVSRAH